MLRGGATGTQFLGGGRGMISNRSKRLNILDLRGKPLTIVPPLEGNPDVLVPKIRAKTKVTNYETKSY